MEGSQAGDRRPDREPEQRCSKKKRSAAWAGSERRSQPGAFVPRGHLAMSGTPWVEARGAAEHSTVHETAPTTKNHSAQNANSAKG